MQDHRYLAGVSTLRFNEEACSGCKVCTEVCPHGVLAMNGRHAEVVDADGCMECGACALNCPTGALSVSPGVGCANAILNSWLRRGKPAPEGASCCC